MKYYVQTNKVLGQTYGWLEGSLMVRVKVPIWWKDFNLVREVINSNINWFDLLRIMGNY
jgi:hypothetical protein